MYIYKKGDFELTKKDRIAITKELFYSDDVIEALEAAKTEGELDRIMIHARNRDPMKNNRHYRPEGGWKQ